jgi:PAS domain S-box-containing protein
MGAGQEVTRRHPRRSLPDTVDDGQDGTATTTASGTVIYANRRLTEILGLPNEEVLGAPMESFVADEDQQVFSNLVDATGEGFTIEVRLLRANGGKIPVVVSAAPLEVSGKLFTCLTFRDATTQAAVENDAARTMGILNSADQVLVGMDSAGRITDWNRQAELTFGRTLEEALGQGLAETILAVDFRAGLTWFLPGGKDRILNRRFESRAVARNGREFPIELVLWEVDNGEGGTSFHALIHDISERRAADDAMRLALSCALAAVAHLPRQSVRSRGRVLVVDDYPMSQLVATTIVEQLGYQVDGVNSGEEAIAAVESTYYDVILMDCTMPVMDGYQATFRIRQLEGPHRHTPIVALTASSMPGDRERCLAAGMDDYVSKPFDPAALSDALARCTPD